jgi:hypothetical protein
VSFVAITLCVDSQRVFIVVVVVVVVLFISLSTQSGNFWIHPRTAEHVADPSVEIQIHIKVAYRPQAIA